jgi:hypothetical protein
MLCPCRSSSPIRLHRVTEPNDRIRSHHCTQSRFTTSSQRTRSCAARRILGRYTSALAPFAHNLSVQIFAVGTHRDRESLIPGSWSERRNLYLEPLERDAKRGKAILTAIDQSIVILCVCLVSVSCLLELDGGYTFGATCTVEVKRY